MKTILFNCLLLCSSILFAQPPAFQPYFSAVVVKDVAASSSWYQSVFGLKIREDINDPNGAYHVVILESPSLLVELLQLKGSLVRAETTKGKSDGTQIQGHFKTGFRVTNMDDWIKHLQGLKINIPRVYTDQASKKRNFLIEDPDGNLIQFFE